MELKVACDCGQKLGFDVTPVNGRMPVPLICPACQTDTTAKADAVLAAMLAIPAAPPPTAETPPAGGGLRLHRAEPVALAADSGHPAFPPAASIPALKPSGADRVRATGECNLGLGILGGVAGAALGAGLMYGIYVFGGFRFPLMGTGIGILTGWGARLLYKGTDATLGGLAAALAALATCGALYAMYGELGGMFVISIGVSGWLAYRVAG